MPRVFYVCCHWEDSMLDSLDSAFLGNLCLFLTMNMAPYNVLRSRSKFIICVPKIYFIRQCSICDIRLFCLTLTCCRDSTVIIYSRHYSETQTCDCGLWDRPEMPVIRPFSVDQSQEVQLYTGFMYMDQQKRCDASLFIDIHKSWYNSITSCSWPSLWKALKQTFPN